MKTTTNYLIEIRDPSGQTRTLKVPAPDPETQAIAIGRDCAIPLRDATLSGQVAELHVLTPKANDPRSGLWIRILQGSQIATLGDLQIRECLLPEDLPLTLGESVLTIRTEKNELLLPIQPSGVKHWNTSSESGRQVLWMTKKAANTPLSIYLAGETGTGKEVLAHLIHAWSDRASGPFVPLHCGALPLSLAESELFGHVKGAFTGASHQRPGALLQAHGGTLFLDEVGDLPLDIQVKLLRFLENGEIRAVGSDQTTRADARILCATHHHLKELVEAGKFRRDLYYRIASVTIQIPTLRERPEDIRSLSQTFAHELGKSISEPALHRLHSYSWPGNVRELRHAVERASGLAGAFTKTLGAEEFAFLQTSELGGDTSGGAPESGLLTLQEMERVMVLRALKISRGNRNHAAKILGVARSTLFEMIKRHRIIGPKSRYTEKEIAA
jgi:two-component system response regulator HydG